MYEEDMEDEAFLAWLDQKVLTINRLTADIARIDQQLNGITPV